MWNMTNHDEIYCLLRLICVPSESQNITIKFRGIFLYIYSMNLIHEYFYSIIIYIFKLIFSFRYHHCFAFNLPNISISANNSTMQVIFLKWVDNCMTIIHFMYKKCSYCVQNGISKMKLRKEFSMVIFTITSDNYIFLYKWW